MSQTVSETFTAYRVEKEGDETTRSLQELEIGSLPGGDVTVKVAYSSLNYKDALSATGNPGVTKNYPHTPGIDAAGTVVSSDSADFNEGDEVIVTSYDLGMETDGGFGQMIRVPAAWVIPLPQGLSLRESMALGTAGLTAALCLDALLGQGLTKESGPVVVTGATGGVGSVAVALLGKLGFETVASTGTEEAHDLLKSLGATEVIDRHELSEEQKRPMLKSRWGGAIDTVGGSTLTNVMKSLKWGASAAACGLVAGPKLDLTVFPFILRGANLLGIDSAQCPMAKRREVWEKLAGEWKPDLSAMTDEITLNELDEAVDAILQGKTQGRTLVRLE